MIETVIEPKLSDPCRLEESRLPDIKSPETLIDAKNLGIGTSFRHWFGRGFLAGLMVIATGNAVSYFVLSEGVSNLIGMRMSTQQDRVGFPLEVWERGKAYGQYMVNFPNFFINAIMGVGLGVLLGVTAGRYKGWLNRTVEEILNEEFPSADSEAKFDASLSVPDNKSLDGVAGNQFSVWGLMACTAIVALIVALATKVSPSPYVMAAIFFLAPAVMIVAAMLPPRLSWQFRVAILSVLALSSIGVAISVGANLQLSFDQVLMGIFICWTPQGAIGTFALLAWLTIKAKRNAR